MILLVGIQFLAAGFLAGVIFAGWYEDRLEREDHNTETRGGE